MRVSISPFMFARTEQTKLESEVERLQAENKTLQAHVEEATAAREAAERKAADDLAAAKRDLAESKQKAHASNQVILRQSSRPSSALECQRAPRGQEAGRGASGPSLTRLILPRTSCGGWRMPSSSATMLASR